MGTLGKTRALSEAAQAGDDTSVFVVALTTLAEITLALDATRVKSVLEQSEVDAWDGVCYDLPAWLGLACGQEERRALAIDAADGESVVLVLGHTVWFEEMRNDDIAVLPLFIDGMSATGGANGVIGRDDTLVLSLDTDRVLALCRQSEAGSERRKR